MKKIIYSNNKNLELVYVTNVAKFYNKEYTMSRYLVLNILDKDEDDIYSSADIFDLDDYNVIYGKIYVRFFALLPDIRTEEIDKMTNAIAKFEYRLVDDLTNEQFALKLKEELDYEDL